MFVVGEDAALAAAHRPAPAGAAQGQAAEAPGAGFPRQIELYQHSLVDKFVRGARTSALKTFFWAHGSQSHEVLFHA